MSWKNQGRKRRTQIDGQFAAREIKMLESPAFRVLSLSARRILDRLEIELAHHAKGHDPWSPEAGLLTKTNSSALSFK